MGNLTCRVSQTLCMPIKMLQDSTRRTLNCEIRPGSAQMSPQLFRYALAAICAWAVSAQRLIRARSRPLAAVSMGILSTIDTAISIDT